MLRKRLSHHDKGASSALLPHYNQEGVKGGHWPVSHKAASAPRGVSYPLQKDRKIKS